MWFEKGGGLRTLAVRPGKEKKKKEVSLSQNMPEQPPQRNRVVKKNEQEF